jgi:hypothetical protein
MSFEIRVDCPSCRVEGARVEVWADTEDGGGQAGAGAPAPPGTARCRLCDASAERRPPATLEELERGLDAWAREEGLASARELVEAYFVVGSPADVLAAIASGQVVETTFDVADYLFSSGGGAGGAGGEPATMRAREEEAAPSTLRIPRPASVRRFGGPREELLALASVAAADGEASQEDQSVLARAAQTRGVPPLAPDEVRVWRPNEIDPPVTLVDRERVLEEMFQTASADGQLDESELRVIRDFARAWGIDPERVREWMDLYTFADSNVVERWLKRIGFFLFPAR